MLVHGSNPNHHRECLDMNEILKSCHQECPLLSKHPWWWFLDFINTQSSLMMIIAIWSIYNDFWWLLFGFDPCPTIADDWDFINVQASLMSIPIFGKKWPNFGQGDNWNWLHNQFLLQWPIIDKIHKKNTWKGPRWQIIHAYNIEDVKKNRGWTCMVFPP